MKRVDEDEEVSRSKTLWVLATLGGFFFLADASRQLIAIARGISEPSPMLLFLIIVLEGVGSLATLRAVRQSIRAGVLPLTLNDYLRPAMQRRAAVLAGPSLVDGEKILWADTVMSSAYTTRHSLLVATAKELHVAKLAPFSFAPMGGRWSMQLHETTGSSTNRIFGGLTLYLSSPETSHRVFFPRGRKDAHDQLLQILKESK